MADEIPQEIRDFIRRYVNSVSLLEVMLLMRRNPQKVWSAKQVSADMRTNPSYATAQLEELFHAKLVSQTPDKTYIFSNEIVDDSLLEQLENLYNNKRSAIIGLIYAQPLDSIRDFANAFKIKKD